MTKVKDYHALANTVTPPVTEARNRCGDGPLQKYLDRMAIVLQDVEITRRQDGARRVIQDFKEKFGINPEVDRRQERRLEIPDWEEINMDRTLQNNQARIREIEEIKVRAWLENYGLGDE